MDSPSLTIMPFIYRINQYIINPLIILVFSIAFVYFLIGVIQFIKGGNEATKREEGKKKLAYGLIGMFIMFSAYGLVRLVTSTFGITPPDSISEDIYP